VIGELEYEPSRRFFLSRASRASSRPSRHNRPGYWTGNGGRARPITVAGQSSGVSAVRMPGDSPRHIRHLVP
jgi:hypothetical protein